MKHQPVRHLHMGCGEPLSAPASLRTLIKKSQRSTNKKVEPRTELIHPLKEKRR
ncbi:MAG: hypothetical protein ABW166_04475 [Sedimenticola sp.]